MFKKSFTICAVIIIGTFWATGAYSWPLPSCGGYPSATYNTITIEQLVKKLNLSNVCDPNPDDDVEQYCEGLNIDVRILEAQANQCNGGDNCGGEGTPFTNLNAQINSSINVDECTFDANGNATCKETITNEVILYYLRPYIDYLLQNPNWDWDPDTVVAPTIEVAVETYGLSKDKSCKDDPFLDGCIIPGDSKTGCFQLPQGFTVGVETKYDLICETACYEYNNGGEIIPDSACSPRLPFYPPVE